MPHILSPGGLPRKNRRWKNWHRSGFRFILAFDHVSTNINNSRSTRSNNNKFLKLSKLKWQSLWRRRLPFRAWAIPSAPNPQNVATFKNIVNKENIVPDRRPQLVPGIDVDEGYGYLYLPLETINPLEGNPELNTITQKRGGLCRIWACFGFG